MRNQQSGFTLVELLVVITIIVVLLSLLAPAMDKAIHRAELLVCQGNTRYIAMAVIDYAMSNRGAVPVYETWDTYMVYSNNPGFATVDARTFLLALTGKREVYYCPLGKLKADTLGKEWDTVVTPVSYAVEITYSPIGIWQPTANQRGYWPTWKTMYTDIPEPSGGTNRPNRLANATNASSAALVVDSQRSFQSTGFSYPGNPAWDNSGAETVYPHRRDDMSWEGTSSSFFDGHSECRSFEEFFQKDEGYPYGARWFMWRHRGDLNYETPMWW